MHTDSSSKTVDNLARPIVQWPPYVTSWKIQEFLSFVISVITGCDSRW